MDDQHPDVLAAMLAQYGPAPHEPYDQYAPMPGVSLDNPFRPSSSYRQFDWAKEHPQMAGSLAKLIEYLSLIPMGASSRAPAAMGRDPMVARSLERAYPESRAALDSKNPADAAMIARMNITPYDPRWEVDPATHFAKQPLPYPDYDYQVHGSKGRWMNDPQPALPFSRRSEYGDMYKIEELVRNERGQGAQPGLPQYPRIPSHWVPEDNPAKFTLRSPRGIPERPAFSADNLKDLLRQIERTELRPADREYLKAMAKQKFGRTEVPPPFNVIPGGKKD